MTYRFLDSSHIIATSERLVRRIDTRFPNSGLGAVSRDFLTLSRECAQEAARISQPHWPIRIGIGLLVIVLLVASVMLLIRPWLVGLPAAFDDTGEYFQVIESSVNDIIFAGIAVFFLFTIEARLKRQRALRWIHQLRSIAHVVDMHQLTKDPEMFLTTYADTDPSISRAMTPAELGRYLDYCSEMLSLASKVAALFVQRFSDPVVLVAVNEIEELTSGLAEKIWQKITILEAAEAR